MPASGEPLPARHGKCGVTAGTARQSPNPNSFAGNAGNLTSRLPARILGCYLRPLQPDAPHSSFGKYLEMMQQASLLKPATTDVRAFGLTIAP
jgi:hypothetical protein